MVHLFPCSTQSIIFCNCLYVVVFIAAGGVHLSHASFTDSQKATHAPNGCIVLEISPAFRGSTGVKCILHSCYAMNPLGKVCLAAFLLQNFRQQLLKECLLTPVIDTGINQNSEYNSETCIIKAHSFLPPVYTGVAILAREITRITPLTTVAFRAY